MNGVHKTGLCRILAALIACCPLAASAQSDFWQPTNGPNGGVAETVTVNSDGHLFAGIAGSGVFRSMDNGETWEAIHTGLAWALLFNCDGHLFAGASGEVLRSTDNGETWDDGSGLPPFLVQSLAVNGDGHIFAGTEGSGVFRSTDNGETWEAINTGMTDSVVWALLVHSDGHLFAGTAGSGVLRSTDNGETWEAVNTGLINTDVRALVSSADGRLFAGTEGGVFRSTSSTTRVEKISAAIPTVFSLAQNYPNPFKPSTTITFSVTKRTSVSLKVFDVVGREVATLVREWLAPSTFSVVFEAEGLPSGVYFYRIEAGAFHEVRKMLILR